MKKSLLVACGLVIVLAAGAQNSAKYVNKKPVVNAYETPKAATMPAPVVQRKKPLVITNAAISDVTLGCANNILGGWTKCGRAILSYCPAVSALTLIHRSGPAAPCSDGSAGSGYYMFDVSKDGGTTWNPTPSLGPISNSAVYTGRYPAGEIYNPTGNTNADSAFIAYHGASTYNNGGTWNAYHTGAAVLGKPSSWSEQIDVFDTTVNYAGYIPDAMMIDNNGIAWVSDIENAGVGNGSAQYDTLILRKGTWSAANRRYTFATTKVQFGYYPGFYAMSNVAFYGSTGYLAAIANADITFSSDSSMYLTVWKSTDAGATWGAAHKISMDVNTEMSTTGVKYGAAFELDGSVDKNGKYHVNMTIAPAYMTTGSITTKPGTYGQFSIITDGTTDTKKLLAKPQTFRGVYDKTNGYSEDLRGQIAETMAGDKMFYVWFETDTASWVPDTSLHGSYNVNPDAWVRMYDVNTGTWDAAKNLTAGTNADGVSKMGYVANWAGQGTCGAGSYQVQLGYQDLMVPGDGSKPGVFHYVGGACVTAVNELENNVFSIGDAYPNPTTGLATISVDLKQNSSLTLDVVNMIGQTVYSTSASNLSIGTHKFAVDASKLNSGVYFYTIKSKDFQITKKLVRD